MSARARPLLLLLPALAVAAALWLVGRGGEAELADGGARPAAGAAPGETLPRAGGPERSAGSEPRTERVEAAEPARSPGAEIAETIRVRAVDLLSREAIAGATVEASRKDGAAAGTTDADGWFDTGLAPSRYALHVSASAVRHGQSLRAAGPEEIEIALELPPRTSLRGRVLDSGTSEPIAGATLASHQATARSAGDGEFVLEPVYAGVETVVSVHARGYGREVVELRIAALAPPPRRDFHLERAEGVRGRVLSLATGAPLAGAQVRAGSVRTRTDPDGCFAAAVVRPEGEDEVRARVRAEGHAAASGPLGFDEELELRLPGVAAVEGTVYDAGGRAVAGAEVVAYPWATDGLEAEQRELRARQLAASLPEGWTVGARLAVDTTDGEGRYRLDGLLPWTPDLRIEVDDEPFVLDTTGPPGGTVRFDVRLSAPAPSGVVTGMVTLNGEPIAARVEWRCGERTGSAATGNGRPYHVGLIEGRVVLCVRPTDLGTAGRDLETRAELEVAAGEEVRHDFTLTAPLVPIEGRVVDSRGHGVATRVHASVGDRVESCGDTSTAADGAFALRVLASSAPVDLTIRAPYFVCVHGVEPGARDVEIVLDPPGRLRFRARDARTDRVVPRVDLRWRRSGSWWYERAVRGRLTPDVAGWFELEIPGTALEVAVIDRGGELLPAERSVSVPPGGVAELDVALEPGLTLELRLAGDGPPPADACLLLEPRFRRFVTVTDGGGTRTGPDLPSTVVLGNRTVLWKDGVARLAGLPADTYDLVVPEGVPLPEPARIELRESGQVVEVRWGAEGQ